MVPNWLIGWRIVGWYKNEFGAMVKGDSFFGRSILLEYLKIDPDAIVDYRSDPSENAKLTVVI